MKIKKRQSRKSQVDNLYLNRVKMAEVVLCSFTKKLTLKISIVGNRVPSEKLDMTNDARHDSNPGRRNSKGLLALSEKTES